ncbi:SDR family oxidoreductase [Nocardioides jishulii]|uniref:SDR family oxidoreductase n=1 Tax=Nocardioides jishulii TaxID=2575440 RepID=A0A4U2YSV5_9ACTN|nr:SDR family oxidoreductase [Nocardioides jishulii]QCX28540.1 SDR family oxidoreductase [Nocardioides jishulii]TKI64567.1 SDR family oxidoreductase [Nocardioides jishulii]
MSKVIIIGGHGKVALRLAPQLVERGDEVTSVFRNPDHEAEVAATGAQPVVGDVETMSTEALTELVRGHDAVVWSAGAGGGDPKRTYAVDRDAAIRSMDAARAAGVERYAMVSFLGASRENLPPKDDSFYPYADAKVAADEHLRDSGLAWTILQPGALTLDEPTGKIDRLDAVPEDGHTSVSRGDVAAVVAAVLADPATVGRSIAFRNGSTPIGDAVQG